MVSIRSSKLFVFIILFSCGILIWFSQQYGVMYGILFFTFALGCGGVTTYFCFKYTTTPNVISPIASSFASVVGTAWASSVTSVGRNGVFDPLIILMPMCSGCVAYLFFLVLFSGLKIMKTSHHTPLEIGSNIDKKTDSDLNCNAQSEVDQK